MFKHRILPDLPSLSGLAAEAAHVQLLQRLLRSFPQRHHGAIMFSCYN
jgi:hypothetical protein